jgi:hypothetical protein
MQLSALITKLELPRTIYLLRGESKLVVVVVDEYGTIVEYICMYGNMLTWKGSAKDLHVD